MRRAEIMLICLLVCGVVFRLLNFPGAGLLIVFGGSLLAIIYLVFSFALLQDIRLRSIRQKAAYGNVSGLTTLAAIAGGWNCGIAIIGLVFKLMFWPQASLVLIASLAGLFVSLILVFVLTKKSDVVRRMASVRIIIIGIFVALFYLTPSSTFADIIYRNRPEYRDALKGVLADPMDEDAQRRLQEAREKDAGIMPENRKHQNP